MTIAATNQLDLAALARLEEHVGSQLNQTLHELDHMDCFDDEQRAEIYTILKALCDYTQAHRGMLAGLGGQWVSDRKD